MGNWGWRHRTANRSNADVFFSSFLFFSFFVPFFRLFLFFLSFFFFFFRLSVFFFFFLFFHVCGEALLVKIHTSVTRLWADTKGRDKAWGVSLATFICDSHRCSSNEGGLNISWQNFGGKPSGAESLLLPVFLSKLVSADLYHTVRRDVTKKIQSLIPDFTRATRHERLGTRLNSKELYKLASENDSHFKFTNIFICAST